MTNWRKASPEAEVSNATDGGTSARVFGSFISWMQEKQAPVFIVATANDVSQFPPELLRKGRFDELFFVDLPNEKEREAIWAIQIQKYGRDAKEFDLVIAQALTELAPLSKLMGEQINALRNWAKSRARFATSPAPEPRLRKIGV